MQPMETNNKYNNNNKKVESQKTGGNELHRLENEWNFFTQQTKELKDITNDKNLEAKVGHSQNEASFENELTLMFSCDSVESFYHGGYSERAAPSHFERPTSYRFFKKGIEPKWEDPKNEKGLSLRAVIQYDVNLCWERLLFLAIGEQIPYSDEICGVSITAKFKKKSGFNQKSSYNQKSNYNSKGSGYDYLAEIWLTEEMFDFEKVKKVAQVLANVSHQKIIWMKNHHPDDKLKLPNKITVEVTNIYSRYASHKHNRGNKGSRGHQRSHKQRSHNSNRYRGDKPHSRRKSYQKN